MNLPTPKTTIGKLVVRLGIVAVIAVLGALLEDPSVTQGGILYLVIKTVYDLLNSNTPNLRA